LISIAKKEPNVILTDLDLGDGPNGADLVNTVDRKFPWINIIVLSTHRNPALATYPSSELPKGIKYITKGDLADKQNLITLINESMSSKIKEENRNILHLPVLNNQQSEVLQLIAKGLSNQAIADVRGVSLRAAEIQVTKVYEILEIENDPLINKRLKAAEIWRNGKVLTV
jgi:DNA-binding NarL/FixJ family response regulator